MTLGVFLNTKQLYHPIFEVVDQESTDHGVLTAAALITLSVTGFRM